MNTKLSESSALHGCAPEPACPRTVMTPNAVSARPARTRSQLTILMCSPAPCLGLALGGAALECLERAQLVPLVHVGLGRRETEPSGISLDDALADADVDRAPLDARRSGLTPEAQIALGERVRAGVVRDARGLRLRLSLVGRERHVAGGEDARFVAAAARHAGVFLDEARAGARFDLHRIDRADVKALGGGTLQAGLLVERAAIGISRLDDRIHLDVRVVDDTDSRRIREADELVLLRADDLAGETTDAERRVGEDHAARELGPGRRGLAGDGRAPERLEGHERDDRCRSAQEVPT